MVALDHQQFGVHPGGVEVPVGDVVSDVGRRVGGHEVASVVVGLVARQGEQTDQRQRDRRDEDRPRPPHDDDTHPAPSARIDLAFRLEQSESAADDDHGGPQRQRGDDGDEDADRAGHSHGLEPRQPRESQAQQCTRDGEAGTQHHVGGAVKHRVVRGFPVLAVASRLLISADEEDRVVGARGDRDERQQARCERRQADDPGIAEERDDSPGGAEFDEHHHQDQDRGGDRAIDEQQHEQDDHERDHRGLGRTLVACDALIGVQRRSAGDVGLTPCGAGVVSMMSRTAAMDSLAIVSPMFPRR